jgi:hypothetical protein
MNFFTRSNIRLKNFIVYFKFFIIKKLQNNYPIFVISFFLSTLINFAHAQDENKGWHFLNWGLSESEVENAVNQYTKGFSEISKQVPKDAETPSITFKYEGSEVSCFFDKGLSKVKEIQHFNYPDSTQAAVAFDDFYYSLAEKLGETITIHDKRAQCKIMSWKFNFTRIKVLFYYSSVIGTKNKANHLELEMTYWRE